MGMFDTVTLDDWSMLPLSFETIEKIKGAWWQTKDFQCIMTDIKITKEGRLMIEYWNYEIVPKAERPYPNAQKGDLHEMCGALRKVNRRWVDVAHHGNFNFYTIIDGSHDWYEFNAEFNDGNLVSITKVPNCEE